MNWYPVDDLVVCDRIAQLRDEWQTANRRAEGEGAGRRTLSDLVCDWRTRVGAAVMAVGRWIVPAEVRASMASPSRLDRC
jgi:hypothetical protein